jgi:hypothetical protein
MKTYQETIQAMAESTWARSQQVNDPTLKDELRRMMDTFLVAYIWGVEEPQVWDDWCQAMTAISQREENQKRYEILTDKWGNPTSFRVQSEPPTV